MAPLGGGAEALATVEGDDWSYGFNLGALCTLPCGTTVGLSYRSGIEHVLDGDIKIGPLPAEEGTADLDLPETAAIGISVPIGESLSIQADATWTGWSSFEDLTTVRDDGSVVSTTDESWEDTWRFALGATVQVNDDLVVRTGCAFDQTPVPDAAHRTARIPDADRTWLTFGAGMSLSDTLSVDVGYAHLWFDDANISEMYGPGTSLVGTYEGEVDIVSLQLAWTI
ncbi:MAG: outer membrane protein transport protein [Kiritimatiellia bacterium]|nr:outer membrane protein transport protein [Kiritimatiellia bacterium]MDP6630280.1 outer membrane protein transport protein [Kiritimatiellia bacterium]MDP6810787.1 outer membrane protein transport protein [Kiritimatiellia bacterium]MDP7024129.1 outer membrane protein transport protein [Kiritimatiellia bacterium]